jgi:hypothetical protein
MSCRARLCEQCRQSFRPSHSNGRYCSRECLSEHRMMAARRTRPRYVYDGRLSDELRREVAAARAEQAMAPLFRPGDVL